MKSEGGVVSGSEPTLGLLAEVDSNAMFNELAGSLRLLLGLGP